MDPQPKKSFSRKLVISILKSGERMMSKQFEHGPVVLGRQPGCDLILDFPFISRTHFQIVEENQLFYLVDLGSRNGLTVQGQKIQKMLLPDSFQFGLETLVFDFKILGPTASAPEPQQEVLDTLLRSITPTALLNRMRPRPDRTSRNSSISKALAPTWTGSSVDPFAKTQTKSQTVKKLKAEPAPLPAESPPASEVVSAPPSRILIKTALIGAGILGGLLTLAMILIAPPRSVQRPVGPSPALPVAEAPQVMQIPEAPKVSDVPEVKPKSRSEVSAVERPVLVKNLKKRSEIKPSSKISLGPTRSLPSRPVGLQTKVIDTKADSVPVPLVAPLKMPVATGPKGPTRTAAIAKKTELKLKTHPAVPGDPALKIEIRGLAQAEVEGLTREQLKQALRMHLGKVRRCYRNSLVQNPQLQGRMKFESDIEPGGRVSSVRLVKNSVRGGEGLAACVQGVLEKVVYPKAKNGRVSTSLNEFPFSN